MVRTIEVENETTIEIMQTLESIGRVNKTIERNKEMGMSKSYIEQWEGLKKNLLGQLTSLLSDMNIIVDLKGA